MNTPDQKQEAGLLQTLRAVEKENRTLAEIGRVITSSSDLDAVYERFAELVADLIPFDRLALAALDPDEKEITTVFSTGVPISAAMPTPIDGTVIDEVRRNRQPLLWQGGADRGELWERFPFARHGLMSGLLSSLLVPLISQDRLVGALVLRSKRPDAYAAHDVETVQRLASQIAGPIANWQLTQELQKALDDLRRSDERFRLTLETTGVGTWDWDIEANTLTWSDSLSAMLGVRPDTSSVTPQSFIEMVVPEDRPRVEEATRRTVREDEPYHQEVRVRRPDGSVHVLETRGRVVRDESGRALRMLGVALDLTERRRSEALIEALSTPVLSLEDRLLLVPLIGAMDSRRADQLQRQLLGEIRARRARAVVLDVTGVGIIDTYVAGGLLQTAQAARLLGTTVVLTGLSADVARALVSLGVEMRSLVIAGELHDGIARARESIAARRAPL